MSETRKPFETFAHYKIGKGFATLSVSVDEGNARVGVAYCHPRDGIDKGFGRHVATKRRDSDSTFSFEFKRKKDVKLGDQLHAEFESFILKAGTERAKLLNLIEKGVLEVRDMNEVRLGAPPWIIHSLNREIRKRERLEKLLDAAEELDAIKAVDDFLTGFACATGGVDVDSDGVPESSSCRCC